MKSFAKIFLVLSVLSFIGFASATTPALIGFQGKLTDKNGVAINGSTSIVFNIYTTSTGGTSLYNETDTVTANNGLVSVLIGSNTSLTLPFNQQYYLGVNVNNDGEMSPRLILSDAPYAFNSITAVNSTYSNSSVNASNANNSAFLGGVAAGSYALTNGNYPSMTVGTATNANNLGGVAASSYFQNGGALTASSASIGGHTPWTSATCSSSSTSYNISPSTWTPILTLSCNSGNVIVSGGCSTLGGSGIYLTASFPYGTSAWGCAFYNSLTAPSSSNNAAEYILCCPN
ncbi:MAG: hypothetical protein M1594_00240 [Candidatus Marsarchaeota archaeon]|nr:hypothetical protein [Candidatus Marsarchaeota archaeon]